ncbi:protein of unknown function [Micropruina glycogenica]|uniref:Uncharacterized protein n=1 Tax=Micropruina glycogenica TaxID=75385 RepID=A0A2N9JHT7_9ACTN|nr:protein of unknown function [Micropruina glycogenica]
MTVQARRRGGWVGRHMFRDAERSRQADLVTCLGPGMT